MTEAGRPSSVAAASRGPDDVDAPPTPIRHVAPVVSNEKVAEATWWLTLESPRIAAATLPGQFLMIGYGIDNSAPPFLPRPFSVAWTGPGGQVGLLLRTFGAGTRRMATLRSGDRALLLGPLGRSFRLEPDRPVTCVAGGVGLAPFILAAREARRRGREVTLLYGERTGARVFDPELLSELADGPSEIFTEDGSLGRRGLVLEGIDMTADPQLLGCGPDPMLVALARFAREHGASLQVSVEEHMGCGVGTCQGCVVRGADGRWIKSCVEGPVFEASDLDWEWRA